MHGFTPLETAVLSAIADDYGDYGKRLSDLVATAVVIGRNNTGHGFYTFIQADRALPPVHAATFLMDGPVVHMQDMGEGNIMGFILELKDGYPDCLEGFQYGDSQGDTVDLKTYDLFALRFTRLEPLPQS